MRSTINTTEQNEIWTEDPLTAYKNFLKYAGRNVNDVVEYNRQALAQLSFLYSHNKSGASQTPPAKELKVHAHNGDFYPLKTSMDQPLYCAKLTIRNLSNVVLSFNLRDDINPRTVSISPNPTAAKSVQIAYRNIVPDEFSNAPQLAGPAGFSEYLIDGTGVEKPVAISFTANSSQNETPLKVVFENCDGTCMVFAPDQNTADTVFENKSADTLKLEIYTRVVHNFTASDDEAIESPSSIRKRF